MISFFSRLKKQKGFSLIEVMIATAMLSIAGLSMVGLLQLANQDSLQLRATRVALTARVQIEAALKNPASWRQTVAQNTSFACVNTPPGCSLGVVNGGYHNFVLYGIGVGEKVTFDASDTTTRYNIQGGACPTGTPNPDPQCPIKFMARWKPLCQTYPCLNPTLDVKISLVPEFGTNAPLFNPQKYEYATVRGIDDGSLQSACQILNGTYNVITGTCYPKNAGRSCAALGRPAQIITSVAADGSITCAPLYSGQCNAATQVMNGINTSGVAQCTTKVQPTNCPTPCVGGWGSCSKTCGGGTQTYAVITPATNGGPACTSPAPGATQACNSNPCAVNCVGSWSACSEPCGGGYMTYSIVTPASNGGASCSNNTGDTQTCNSQACAVAVNCDGSWSGCNQVTGTRTYTVTQVPQNGGVACPSPLTQNCAVDCVGSWGACSGGPPQFKTYTWTTPPLNGGSTATCAYPNGQTDSATCLTQCIRYGTDPIGTYIDDTGTYSATGGIGDPSDFAMITPYTSRAACESPPNGFDFGEWCVCK
ncbi:MAG: prepilin-type N-terminal cleavage/methylation domain-containing protein [Bdellovibrionaceae bacterium]|nr:prepilin-type N-terminal cleavage/methylation domain-containing protein [Pseudobdellovibrionaceae bacterium]